jgi:asparagine synthetase B (glutamine-hydrolysing)
MPALMPSSLDPSVSSAPYFRAVRQRGGVTVSGTETCTRGHALATRPGLEPDGIFVGWHWDGDRLSVWNDRYGFHPCYYHAGPDGVSVSPSIPALLAAGAPVDLDDDALAVFTRVGFFLDDATPFRAIRTLPAGSRLTWCDGHTEIARASRPEPPRERRLERSAALDAYIDVFRAAIRRRLRAGARTCVPLSGGRDSRHILLELDHAGARPDACVSYEHYPPRRNADVAVAAALCRRLNVPHVVLQQREPRLRAELRKNQITSFCSDEHAQVLVLADHVRGRVDALYDGIAGDVLSGGLFLDRERLELVERGAFEALARLLLAGRGEDARAGLVTAPTAHRLRLERAVASLAAELARHADAPNPIGSFYFWNRTRREIALGPYALVDGVADVFAPYLDHEVFDLLTSLPASLLLDHAFHTDAIARAFPRLQDVPYAAKGRITEADRRSVRRFAIEAAAYAAGGGSSSVVRLRYVLPRLLRGALDGDYTKLDWFGPVQAIYLLQLERFITAASRGVHQDRTGAAEAVSEVVHQAP